MCARKPTLLMCVFNPIEFDGRVQRSAETLASDFDVCLYSVDAGGSFNSPSFRTTPVRLTPRGSKYAAHLAFARRILVAARQLRPTVVYAHDYFMAFPGWVAARLARARFVYDAHELIIPGPGERHEVRDAIWYRLERAVVARADLVIAANPERAYLMREHYRLPAQPITVRNIAAPADRRLADAEVLGLYPALRRTRPDELLVVYQGDISLARGLDAFLDAARLLPDNYRLLLVGGGPDLAALTASTREQGGTSVSMIGRVPRDHLQDILRLCDIGLVSYPMQGLNNVYCAPNKIYEYAQAGLPVVTTPQPPLQEMLDRFGIGEVAGAPAPSGGVRAEQWAAAIRTVGANLARFARRLPSFVTAHDWEQEQDRLRTAVAQVSARSRRAPVTPAATEGD